MVFCQTIVLMECCTKNCHKRTEEQEDDIDEYEEGKSDEESDVECCSSKTLFRLSND